VSAGGRLLAAGRDADIFEYGDALVLRRSREGRSLRPEAETIAYLHEQGYPVPVIHELSDDGLELVMERIDGPTLVEDVARRPWTVWRAGRVLADLHLRLHEIEAPPFLPPSPVGEGTRVMHRDLHPLNVLVTSSGPVVIDWTGACAGEPDVDVVIAWVLTAVGHLPEGAVRGALLTVGRRLLLDAFLGRFDRTALAARLRDVVTWKARDPHMSEAEVAAMWALVAREAVAG